MSEYISNKEGNKTGVCFLNYQQCIKHLTDESHKKQFESVIYALIYPNIVFLTDDASVAMEDVVTSLSEKSSVFKRNILDVLPVTGDKVQTIRRYVSEHDLKRTYIVLDDDNLLVDFPGLFFSTHVEALKVSAKQLERIKEDGFWWNIEDRQLVRERHRREYREDIYENVIFLDIDGVLNEEDYCDRRKIHEERVERLAQIAHSADAEIVLTSSWRGGVLRWFYYDDSRSENDPPSQLLSLLGKYHLSISDITEDLDSGADARPLEVRTWLTTRPDLRNFVILDDEDFWKWNWLKRFFVLTRIDEKKDNRIEWMKGINDDNVKQAIEILGIVNPKKRY